MSIFEEAKRQNKLARAAKKCGFKNLKLGRIRLHDYPGIQRYNVIAIDVDLALYPGQSITCFLSTDDDCGVECGVIAPGGSALISCPDPSYMNSIRKLLRLASKSSEENAIRYVKSSIKLAAEVAVKQWQGKAYLRRGPHARRTTRKIDGVRRILWE
jgi:hypothetical protein